MGKHSLVPRPWWQVALTVLPGLILLLGEVSSFSPPLGTGVRFLSLAIMILLIVSSILFAVMRRSLFQVPVWGLIPLGFLAGLGLLFLPSQLGFYLPWFLLAITGLLFARHNGLSASLFVLAGGLLTTSWQIEPSMLFPDGLGRRIFIGVGWIVWFTILTPIWVLRSRSAVGQAVALLFPIAAYSAAFVFALSSASGFTHPWFQFSISQSISVARPFIALFATVAIASAVYAWVQSRDFTVGKAQRPSAI